MDSEVTLEQVEALKAKYMAYMVSRYLPRDVG